MISKPYFIRNIYSFLTFISISLLSHLTHAVVFQAENYTYAKDLSPGNIGGAYRSGDVDIENTSDTGGGYNVGWIDAGEWVSFSSLVITDSGEYKVRLRVASASGGGAAAVDLNGGSILLSNVTIPNTGGWQNWQTVEFTKNINAGTYSLGVSASKGGWNFNWIEVVKNTQPPPASVANVFQHCNYTGWSAGLAPGQYTLSQLSAFGFKNDDASSIRVGAGYEAQLFNDDNFTGNSIVVTADDSCLVNRGMNDVVSSIIVRQRITNPPPVKVHKSEKRGMAYGQHSLNDMKAMQHNVRWWYNWSEQPEAGVASSYQDYGFDFVPMAWGNNFDENRLRNYLNSHPNVKYLLGFNEPNFVEQANMTPAQAAAAWPRLEAIARDYNLKIVGPAVNYSPGQVDIPGTTDDSSPWAYLDAFFAACPNCKVDYIAVHCYMKYGSALEWFVGEFERYGKPIWLTEWASWDDGGPANVNEQMDYLASTVRWLEANPKVHRYAWFIGRHKGQNVFPYLDLLGYDGELTPLGGLYTSIPALDYYYQIPTRIEAEGAHRNQGFRHEKTTDSTGGYVNLSWTNTGDWLEYKINVPTTGTYRIDLRLATERNDRSLNILLGSNILYKQTLSSTGGWQAWRTFSRDVTLTAGQHTLRIEALSDEININWLEIVRR